MVQHKWKLALVAVMMALFVWLFQSNNPAVAPPALKLAEPPSPGVLTPSRPSSSTPHIADTPANPSPVPESPPLPTTPAPADTSIPVKIPPISGVVVDREGRPVANGLVLGVLAMRTKDPYFKSSGPPPGSITSRSDSEGKFFLFPASIDESYHVGVPMPEMGGTGYHVVHHQDHTHHPLHKSGDNGLRVLIPFARLNLRLEIPAGAEGSRVKEVPSFTWINGKSDGSRRRTIQKEGFEIDIRLTAGIQAIRSISTIEKQDFTLYVDVPPGVELTLAVNGKGWKPMTKTFQLEPGEVLEASIPLELSSAYSILRLANIRDPELFPSGKVHWADITGHETSFSHVLSIQNHAFILRKLGIQTNQMDVDQKRDPVIEFESGVRKSFLVAAEHPGLFPRVFHLPALEAGLEETVDARLARGGYLEIKKGSTPRPHLMASFSLKGSPEFTLLHLHCKTGSGLEEWGSSIHMDSITKTVSCLSPGDYVLNLHSGGWEQHLDFKIAEGETTRIEID